MTRLSRAAQLEGQRRFTVASYFNPLGAGLTIGPLIALLAMHYGASDLVLGILFAAPHLGNVAAIFGPTLLAGSDTSRIMAGVWLWRAFVGLGYLALPFLPGNDLKITVLVITCYAFMSLRAFGVTAFYPVLKALARPRELNSFTSSNQTGWHSGILITTIISFLVLREADAFPSTEWAYMSLLGLGFIFNLYTALLFHRLPPTGTLDGGSFRSVAWAFRAVATTPDYREVAIISTLIIVGMVAASFQLAYLKQVMHLDDATVFALTLASVLAAILFSRINRIAGAAMTSRGLLFGAQAGLLVGSLCWLLVDDLPANLQLLAAGLLLTINSGLLATAGTVDAGLRAGRLPDRNRVQITLVYQMTGVLAAASGITMVDIIGGFMDDSHGPTYDHAFLIWAACSAALCLLAIRMRGNEKLPLLRDLLQLHPTNLSTIQRLQQIDRQGDETDNVQLMRELEQLATTHTPAGKTLLLDLLASPEVRKRLHGIRALPDQPVPEAIPLVAAEARNIDSPLRHQAITVLGIVGDRSVIPLLRDLLADRSEIIRAAAYKGLLRLGEPYTADEVIEQYRDCHDAQARLDLVIGLMAASDRASLWRILAHDLPRKPHVDWQCALLMAIATCGHHRQRLSDLLGLERERAESGIDDCILDLDDCGHADGPLIAAALRGHDYERLPQLCRVPATCVPDNPQCAIGLVYCGLIHGETCGPPRELIGTSRIVRAQS